MIRKQIPMISSGVAGPLGVLHLPRLWQKASLGAVGKLHDDYPSAGKGYDQMVLDALDINREEFLAFVASKKPTYPETEAWIREKCGGAPDEGAVSKLNAAIAGYLHDDSTRSEILDDCRVRDSGETVRDAISLNNLDDWNVFHRSEIAGNA